MLGRNPDQAWNGRLMKSVWEVRVLAALAAAAAAIVLLGVFLTVGTKSLIQPRHTPPPTS